MWANFKNKALDRFNYFMRYKLNEKKLHSLDPIAHHQLHHANTFTLISFIITAVMGFITVKDQNFSHFFILFTSAALYLSAWFILRFDFLKHPYYLATNVMLITTIMLMSYLVSNGGSDDTGTMWIYIITPMALFFRGIKVGSIHISIFTIILCILLFYPDNALLSAHYETEFKIRLLISFLAITSLFVVYERIRQSSYQALQQLSLKFEHQAKYDMLSDLFNRRGMIEKLEDEYNRIKRTNMAASVILCDIDNFKYVNDQYGHDKGDEIIQKIASIFSSNLRAHDTVARWGGEEFLFLLPTTNIKQAEILANKLRNKIEEFRFENKKGKFNVTVSMGLHELTANESINYVITKADHNLYRAKANGRNCCVSSI